ncbi:PAS domain S-box protein [Halorubrum sp. JWXQ-INN 858]|uniref:ATP-binding protein n=1 Tax=Halorubrum sp. JWXQ-INN 858 TaxID=2690782 RepID=UPI00135812F5|nr:ATP-binding protein [Halorubrum sp. JWXQ-INN 858]MWV64804.1 PAS domain S-box protein [Halorubrum sp. JWXQ-INN 858]
MSESTRPAEEARRRLYEIVRGTGPFEEKARGALALGERYLSVDNGHLTRIDQETDHWEAMVSTDPPDGRFPAGLELDLGTTYCRRTLGAGGSVALSDATDQGWADDAAYEAHGLRCYHGTTLVLEGEPYGTVCFVAEAARSDPFTDAETMFAELLTRLLERELEREHHEAELTRQTNLATVLNRVLRHNIRNDMSVIRGFVQLMADELDDDEYSEITLTKVDDLIELSEKARELNRIVTADFEREPVPLGAFIEGTVEPIAEEHPAASITVDTADLELTVAVLPNFEQALDELIENAIKHSGDDPTVTVTVDPVPNAVEVRITDDGPGLADHEADVMDAGTETPLVHGSGLGLWLVHWIVTSHGGSVDATVTDAGTTMTVSVPRRPATNARAQLTDLSESRDKYRAAFEEACDAMVIINDESRIVDANPAAATLCGLDQQALLGQSLSRFHPDEFDFESGWQRFQRAEQVRDTVTLVDADGTEHPVEYTATTDVVPGQHLVIYRELRSR